MCESIGRRKVCLAPCESEESGIWPGFWYDVIFPARVEWEERELWPGSECGFCPARVEWDESKFCPGFGMVSECDLCPALRAADEGEICPTLRASSECDLGPKFGTWSPCDCCDSAWLRCGAKETWVCSCERWFAVCEGTDRIVGRVNLEFPM